MMMPLNITQDIKMEIGKHDHLTRHLDLIPLRVLGEPITIIGAGAIGSFTALQLAKMGFGNISVWDGDSVAIENMGSQFYRFSDIGKSKVLALHDLVFDFTRVKLQVVDANYEGGRFSGIVISAVDSMAVRKTIWENHKNKSPATRAIIDPRMGAEYALLYTALPMDKTSSYDKTLYSDDSSVQERCTAKATIYTANMLSGLVAKTVKDLVTDNKNYLRSAQWSIKDSDFIGHLQEK